MQQTTWLTPGLIFLGLAPWNGSQAATIRVPQDQPSVLLGVDAASPGDTVLVGPGTWTDKATRFQVEDGFPTEITACAFPQHGMTIVGEQGAENTILDHGVGGSGYNRIVTYFVTGTEKLVLEGLTLTGSMTTAPRVYVHAFDSGGLIVRSCRFRGSLDGTEDAGIFGGKDWEQTEIEVYSSVFENFDSIAGAILLFSASLRAEDCRFQNNIGKCIQVDNQYSGGDVVIDGCEFIGNRGPGYGVGVDLVAVQEFRIENSAFEGNVAEVHGAGSSIRLEYSNGSIDFNVFAYDSVLVSGGTGAGVFAVSSVLDVRNNTFVGCHAQQGAAYGSGAGSVNFENNVIAYSTGGVGVRVNGTGFGSNFCNLFWSNFGGDYGNWPPSPGDLHADPLFCGLPQLDFTVQDNSPCIVGGCGQVGALGVGCTKISVESTSWGRIKGLYRLER